MSYQKKDILLLTLVHPDFLPPVYAVAQVLRDEGYNINILSFDSYVPSAFDVGPSISIQTLGHYEHASLPERFRLRKKFNNTAKALIGENTEAVIAFCSFSFVIATELPRKVPLIYVALEIANFTNDLLLASPLTYLTNRNAIRNLNKADIVATPSIMRSAWLAGRGNINYVPLAVYNTAYYTEEDNSEDLFIVFKNLVPSHLLSYKKIIYTGAVNEAYCVWELVNAFERIESDSILIVSGIKDNEYCNKIRNHVNASAKKDRIILLPVVTRTELVALQRFADIGICLSTERSGIVNHGLIAPNKVGEYIYNRLYLLGNDKNYMQPFEAAGIARVIDQVSIDHVARGLKDCLDRISEEPDIKDRIRNYAKDIFCMQKQFDPVLQFIKSKSNKG